MAATPHEILGRRSEFLPMLCQDFWSMKDIRSKTNPRYTLLSAIRTTKGGFPSVWQHYPGRLEKSYKRRHYFGALIDILGCIINLKGKSVRQDSDFVSWFGLSCGFWQKFMNFDVVLGDVLRNRYYAIFAVFNGKRYIYVKKLFCITI